MRHAIPVESLGPQGEAMAKAVEACVHCGFCLPACPTYHVLSEEMDSPRGRILLMKEVLEGGVEAGEALPYIDRCLGCLGCVTACHSGVAYGDLITSFRAWSQEHRQRPVLEQATRRLVEETLPFPGRFGLAARLGKLAKPLAPLLPGSLGAMLVLLPGDLPTASPLPARIPAQGERRARVAFLTGCVQQVLDPEINWATVRVLARNGVEVVIPQGQGCCGALSMHTGAGDQARALARHNLALFPQDVDAIINNAAGCGSGMHEYPLLFAGQPEEEQARAFAAKVMDVSLFLARLGFQPPPPPEPPLEAPIPVAYHDACHLAHAQGIRQEPRQLLRSVPGLSLVEIPQGEICCGSAGTYNLEQPAIAHQLGERKARAILGTGAQAVATGNIGCMTQIRAHLERLGHPLPILHTVELLDRGVALLAKQPAEA